MNNLDPAVAQVSLVPHNVKSLTVTKQHIKTHYLTCSDCCCLNLQFPQELVTYGGNGQVFSNWAQVRLLCLISSYCFFFNFFVSFIFIDVLLYNKLYLLGCSSGW